MDWDFIEDLKSTLDKCVGNEPMTIEFGAAKKDEWNKSPVIYVIRLADGDPATALKQYEEYYKTKHCKGKFHLPPSTGKPSSVLYVGKKKAGVAERLNEHWYAKASTNSSLRIANWGEDLQFKIDLYVFPEDSISLLAALEFGLADQLSPAIGQHGKI